MSGSCVGSVRVCPMGQAGVLADGGESAGLQGRAHSLPHVSLGRCQCSRTFSFLSRAAEPMPEPRAPERCHTPRVPRLSELVSSMVRSPIWCQWSLGSNPPGDSSGLRVSGRWTSRPLAPCRQLGPGYETGSHTLTRNTRPYCGNPYYPQT